jgi:hypothetical protein
MAPLVVA